MTGEPYVVEVESDGCERCHAGKMWTVVGPDGVAIGQSFKDKDDASDLADLMNDAYEHGKAGR